MTEVRCFLLLVVIKPIGSVIVCPAFRNELQKVSLPQNALSQPVTRHMSRQACTLRAEDARAVFSQVFFHLGKDISYEHKLTKVGSTASGEATCCEDIPPAPPLFLKNNLELLVAGGLSQEYTLVFVSRAKQKSWKSTEEGLAFRLSFGS